MHIRHFFLQICVDNLDNLDDLDNLICTNSLE